MTNPVDLLTQRLSQCLLKDRHALRQKLSRLRTAIDPTDPAYQALCAQIERSVQSRQARQDSLPVLDYPEELPVVAKKDEILAAIQAHPVVVICGETGSGKTTQLPKICLEAGRGVAGYIGHTQPRRLAARTVATRIAEELKQPIGQAVGYKVRFQDHTRAESLIKLMTDGILLAETRTDRFLEQYDTLIVDEAHERSLNIDFLLGYLKWVLPKRPDLKIIITSATIDPQRFSTHFNKAPIIEVSGRTYPVDIRYRPVALEDADETENGEQQAIVEAVEELWRDQNGDILIFLSGEREIRETTEYLRKHHGRPCEILPLYSRLSVSDQDKVFKPTGQRRIILATNVAETSLTVPGIRAVIDTGYARISRYSHRSKLQRLPIEKISQASAKQRAGRCGRLGPGICIRLYSAEDFINRVEFTDPEILRTNLAAVILQMQSLRLGDIARFPFVEAPDERLVRDGLKTLQELNALDEQRRMTPLGLQLARLPVDPRLGRMLLAGAQEHCLNEVAIIVSALSIPDPRERPAEKTGLADQKHARFKHEQSDFLGFLALWNEFETQKKHLSRSKLRQWCRENLLSYLRLQEWHDIHGQIMEVILGELALKLNQAPGEYPEIHRALLSGLLSNVSLKQDQNEYVGARGLKHFIHPGSYLFKAKPKWIMAAEQVETSKVYARTVAKIEPEWIETIGQHLIKHQYYDPHWERKAARAAIHDRTLLFGLTLQAGRKVPYETIDPVAAREIFIRCALVQMDYDSKAPFFLHNLKLLEEAEYLQQKGRRVDLLVDETWLYRFFDERIPAEVVNGITFEKWRKGVERQTPDLLKLTRADITRKEDSSLDGVNFPDTFDTGPFKLSLDYRFEPGHADDGVTVIIPLHLLNQLEPDVFRWLVPGLLREKLIALIKSLPKTWRVQFVPVPDYVDRILPMLDFARGDLLMAVSLALRKVGGHSVPVNAFREDTLPVHLRMNFAVVDEFNKVMDRSRDLAELKSRHSGEARQNFTRIAREVWLHTGCQSWSFGPLPERFEGQQEGVLLHGFPAMVDEGNTVGVRVFDTPEPARYQHALGLARLFRLALAKELKYIKKNLVVNVQAERLYQQLPPHPFLYPERQTGRELREDLLDRLMGALFLEGQPDIRSAADFEQRLETHRGQLVLKADEMARTAQTLLQTCSELNTRLGAAKTVAVADVRDQMSKLLYAGFWATTPYLHIREMPRYLKAMLHRLEKSAQDPHRDQKQYQEIAPFLKKYWSLIEQAKGRVIPEQQAFRWLLEEFRVSLFAQTLKTALPVSAKRLEEAWKQTDQAS